MNVYLLGWSHEEKEILKLIGQKKFLLHDLIV